MSRGAFAELERRALEQLALRPEDARFWQLLTVSLQRQGRSALHAATQAAQGMPGDAVAQLALANELARAGQLAQACVVYGRALAIRGDFAEAHANLGEAQFELGEWHESAASCQRALAISPDLCQAHHTLAKELQRLHRLEEALRHFHQAVTLDPARGEARIDMAVALRRVGRLDEAEATLREALERDPDFARARLELAIVCRLGRRTEECEHHCALVLQSEPESSEALAIRAELLADLGDFAQAESLHRRALAQQPERIESIAALAHLRRMTAADGDWRAQAQTLLTRPWPAGRARLLHYALGKYFDDMQDFDAGFLHYQRANELANQGAPAHDAVLLTRTVKTIIDCQTRAWMDANRTRDATERPVFIVGMPRSGTTLAEQILASHPAIYGAGELSFWGRRCAPAYAAAATGHATLPFGRTEIIGLGSDYLELVGRLPTDASRVVDKFPANFFFLGLIHAAFPRARIIHMQRDPRDTCLSIYFQQFEAANTYANDLQHLADYYRSYRRLMAHWRGHLPKGVMLDVPYEQLVADPETWCRAMVEFTGLPWDAQCLEFHRTPRTVVTASRWQVRQGMLESSVGRWRRYEKHLGPLRYLGDET